MPEPMTEGTPQGLPNSELESLHRRLHDVVDAFGNRNERLAGLLRGASSLLGISSVKLAGDAEENVKHDTNSIAALASLLEEEAATCDRLLLDLEKVIGFAPRPTEKDVSE